MVELVEQDRDIRRLAHRLGPEDGDVAGIERDGGVRKLAMTPRAEPQVRRLAAVGTFQRPGQDQPVEMTPPSPARIAAGIDPPRTTQRAPPARFLRSPVERPREDRVVDHRGEIGLAVMIVAANVHLARREPLETERTAHAAQRVEPGQPVQGHRSLASTRVGTGRRARGFLIDIVVDRRRGFNSIQRWWRSTEDLRYTPGPSRM